MTIFQACLVIHSVHIFHATHLQQESHQQPVRLAISELTLNALTNAYNFRLKPHMSPNPQGRRQMVMLTTQLR